MPLNKIIAVESYPGKLGTGKSQRQVFDHRILDGRIAEITPIVRSQQRDSRAVRQRFLSQSIWTFHPLQVVNLPAGGLH
jgi:hypothetical protein